MKGVPEVIASLNELIKDYHASFIFFKLMGATCDKWGYSEFSEYFNNCSKECLEVIDKILKRVLYLDGNATLDNLDNTYSIETIEEMLQSCKNTMLYNIASLIKNIEIATKFKDFGTRHLVEKILVEEEKHLATIEAKMIQFSERIK